MTSISHSSESDELRAQTAQALRRPWGKYRGFVVDNEDPEQRGRLRLRVPSVLGSEVSGWALPCMPFGGLANQGWFLVPEVDAQVWVEFAEGDVDEPLWTGTFWQASGDVPEEAARPAPTNRVLKTPSGHVLELDDEDGEERVRLAHQGGAELLMEASGNLSLTDSEGARLLLDAEGGEVVVEDTHGNRLTLSAAGTTVEDAHGNVVEMAASGITVSGTKVVVEGQQVALAGAAGEPLIKGQSFLTLFATHVHPTGVGPSGPPIPQGEMTTLSQKVTTS